MSMEISNEITSHVMDLKTSKSGVTRKEEIKTGFNNVDDVDNTSDDIVEYNSVTNYRSTLFRGNTPILSKFKVPSEIALKCNNMRNNQSDDCFQGE